MDKETFLRLQYLRMINSEEFVVEQWRSSIDRFISDMWDRTPNSHAARFLAPVEMEMGFSPDNVEWQFPKIKPRKSRDKRDNAVALVQVKPSRPTKAERKAARLAQQAAARDAKRKAIGEEFANWERHRESG